MSSPIEQKRSRFLPMPRMVAEAKEQSQGHSLIVEVLIFVLLYIIGSVLLQGIITVVGAVLLGAYNEMFQTISESGSNLSTDQINQLTSDVVSSPAMLIFSLFSTIASIATVLIYCRFIEKRKLATLGYRSRNFISEYFTGLFVGTLVFGTGVA
ncbi:MAG: hypothetical protein LBG68_03390, partial [Coriobacteriales bacterium]|nr:hypothetical protein [Coriobacteriales bacterium]